MYPIDFSVRLYYLYRRRTHQYDVLLELEYRKFYSYGVRVRGFAECIVSVVCEKSETFVFFYHRTRLCDLAYAVGIDTHRPSRCCRCGRWAPLRMSGSRSRWRMLFGSRPGLSNTHAMRPLFCVLVWICGFWKTTRGLLPWQSHRLKFRGDHIEKL